MKRRQLLARATALVAVPAAGCVGGDSGGGEGTATPTEPATEADRTVRLTNTAFDPVELEVSAGATVRWVNDDQFDHDVTAAQFSGGAASWEMAETLGSDESTTHTFDSDGIYEYNCTIHGEGTMCGVVVVGGVSYDGSLPCQGDSSGGDGGYGY